MRQVKVWDLLVRLSHWGLGLLVLGSFLTSDEDGLTAIHVRIGLGVLAVVAARVAWGFVGSEPARFRSFVRRPREVAAYARALAFGRPPLHRSHNPLGGAMVIALLAVLLALVATGAFVYAGPEFGGPLTGVVGEQAAHAVKEVHEALSTVLLGMIAAHVAGVLFSSWRERQNLVLGMITGWKLAPDAPVERAKSRWRRLRYAGGAGAALVVGALAAAALALVLGFPGRTAAASPIATARPSAPAALLGAGTLATASDHGERGHHGHRHHGEHHGRSRGEAAWSGPTASSDPEGRALYRKECGACHLAYPPQLLPAASLRLVMAGLDRHFGGVSVDLEPATRDRIERYLVESSGGGGSAREVAPGSGAPTRITELRWFQRKHRRIDARVIARPSVRSLSNCAACHRGADDWDFDEDRVKIPPG